MEIYTGVYQDHRGILQSHQTAKAFRQNETIKLDPRKQVQCISLTENY